MSVALGEENAELEASADPKGLSCGRRSCRALAVDILGPGNGAQLPRLEAEGGPASPLRGAEALPAPACPGPSGAFQLQASNTSQEPGASGCQPALICLLPPAGVGTRDHLHLVGSQVGTKANGTVDLPNTVLWEYVPTFSHHFTCFPSPCTRWGIGELGCDDFYVTGSPGQSDLGTGGGLCPQHLLFLNSVTGDILRTGDAMAKTYCPEG